MYEKVTRDILVRVRPQFLENQSDPANSSYCWAYTIQIENRSNATVTLRTRHWDITDANGRKQTVRGDGVVGEQPVLPPGKAFEYTSGCPLETPSGIMVGSYGMQSETGEIFDIAIPAFSLDSHYDKRRAN
jgi:ApaG protein